jgi:hypothetical protein
MLVGRYVLLSSTMGSTNGRWQQSVSAVIAESSFSPCSQMGKLDLNGSWLWSALYVISSRWSSADDRTLHYLLCEDNNLASRVRTTTNEPNQHNLNLNNYPNLNHSLMVSPNPLLRSIQYRHRSIIKPKSSRISNSSNNNSSSNSIINKDPQDRDKDNTCSLRNKLKSSDILPLNIIYHLKVISIRSIWTKTSIGKLWVLLLLLLRRLYRIRIGPRRSRLKWDRDRGCKGWSIRSWI